MASGDYSLIVGLLIMGAPLVVEHRFWGVWASVVVAPRALEPRLSGYGAWASLALRMWDLPGSGMEPTSPALAGGFFTTEPPEKPLFFTVTSSDRAGCWWKGLASSAQGGIPLRGSLCSGAPRWMGRGPARSAPQPTSSPVPSFRRLYSSVSLPRTCLFSKNPREHA